jgi:phosphatidylserine decarboxylase
VRLDRHRLHSTAWLPPWQPQAVNANFDVFSSNRRDTLLLNWTPKGAGSPVIPVAFVAIGAMLVGSIGWTNAYFAYGGSTIVCVFPPEAKVQWDQDLKDNSANGIETMVRVGDRIGVSNA